MMDSVRKKVLTAKDKEYLKDSTTPPLPAISLKSLILLVGAHLQTFICIRMSFALDLQP